MHIRSFWSNLSGNHREVAHAPAIAGLMAKGDAIVYDVRHHQGYYSLTFTNVDSGNFGTVTLATTVIYSGSLVGKPSSAGRQDGEGSTCIP